MIGFLLILLGVLACLFVVMLIAFIVIGITSLIRGWQHAGAVIAQTQAELAEPDDALATAVTCQRCRPGGHGQCRCTANCGDRQCTSGYTSLRMITAEEAAWLRGLGISEGDHQ